MAPATRLRRTESWPSVGSTRLDWTTSSGTGRAPELSNVLRFVAVFPVNPPSMNPLPLGKTVLIRGAEISTPSSVIWTGLFR